MSIARTDWDTALDDLERELDVVEAALVSGTAAGLPTAWTPPEVSTRIPTHLVPRAVELLTRQDAVLVRLRDAVSSVREQLAWVGTAHHDTAPEHAPPVFLDQSL